MKFKVKYFEMEVKETGTFIKNPENLLKAVKDDFDYNESMVVIGMNTKNNIIMKKTIAMGTHNCIMIKPSDIFVPLLKTNARNFIIVHNHPSGDSNPSDEDKIFTKKLSKASRYVGLNFLDHMIIGTDSYSLQQNNEM